MDLASVVEAAAGMFGGCSDKENAEMMMQHHHPCPYDDMLPMSSPLVHSDSGSSIASSSSSASSNDDLPTPKDPGSSPATAGAARVTRRTIKFSEKFKPSCQSSPKHRYHPYPRPVAGAGSTLSSSPILLDRRKSRAFLAHQGSSIKTKPKSILKQRVKPPSQPASPRKTPPSSPRKSITTSTTSSVIVQPTFFSLSTIPTAEKLAKITKDNAIKRHHTLAFPDLQAHDSALRKYRNTSDGTPSTMPALQPVGSGSASGVRQEGVHGLGASQMVENGGQEDGDMQGPENKQGSSTDADPRQHIISALYTLQHSLKHPAWVAPDPTAQSEADAFESSPADFEPRNLPSSSTASVSGKWPLLREIESAYANIFTHAHAYIVSAHASAGKEASADKLDEIFTTLQTCLLSCLIRDIHNAINPVPVPSSTSGNEMNGSSSPVVSPAPTPSASDTQASRQALLERPGLASSSMNIQLGSSPRMHLHANHAPFPSSSSSPAVNGAKNGTPDAKDGKPKKVGRSSAEMRRRRSEIVVAEAAIQAAGALFSCRRFTRFMDAAKITEFLDLLAQLPNTPALQTAKYRDLLSSMNWLLANQCLSAYPDTKSSIFTCSTSTNLANSLLDSLRLHAGKNREKARRTTSEAFRALRTLILANPENVLPCFVQPTQKRSGTCSFIATHLCNLARPLRDNAALLLAAIAYGATSAWRDNSEEGRAQQNKVQEAISFDLYRHWSMSENELELQNLENALTLASTVTKPTGIHSKDVLTAQNQAGDFAFVRLVINSLPILLGRRFRKMERKGPHTWLRKALAVKTLDNIDSVDTADAKHILAFLPVLYAWAGASKEMAAKSSSSTTSAIAAARKGDFTSASDSNNDSEEVWALGNKAVRVIVQNIEVIDFTQASAAQQENAYAATQLIVAYLYTFSGLIPTLHYPSKDDASASSTQIVNVNLHRDVSKLWRTFVEAHLPRLFESSSAKIRQMGWETLLAILRQGEENVEDSAQKAFRLEKAVNGQMLARCKSQTAQPVALSEIYEDMVRPHEIPSWSIEWVYNERAQIMDFLKVSLQNTFKAIKEEEYESLEWIRSEDGYRILPVAFSTTFRAFLTTLRNATGMNSSQADPTDRSQTVSREIMQFCLELARDLKMPAGLTTDLGDKGAQYAIIQHLFELLGSCFGMAGRETASESVADLALAAVLRSPASGDASAAEQSAYGGLMRRLLDSRNAISAQSSAAVVNLMSNAPQISLKLMLWELVGTHLLNHIVAKKEDDASLHNASAHFLAQLPRIQTGLSAAHIKRFEEVLAASSRLDAVAAWSTIKAIAAELLDEQKTSFFPWSLKLLLPRLADLSKDLIFAEAIVSHLNADVETDAILAGAFNHFKNQALPTIKTLLPLLEKRLQPSTDETSLYFSVLDAFSRAYQAADVKPDLEEYSTLLLAGLHSVNVEEVVLPEVARTFVTIWNKTYGSQEGSLNYPEALKDALGSIKKLDLGIILPGWPEEPIAEEVEQVSEAEESLLEESIEQTLDLNMLATQQQQPLDIVFSPQVQEPPQDAPRVHVSMTQPLQTVEEREETPERDAEPMLQDLKAADALSPPPSLSQIPEIVPATSVVHDSGSTTVVLETPQLPSEEFAAPQQQSQEASIDMIPETQRAPSAAADDIDSQISRLSESFVESQMPHRFPLLPNNKTGEKAVITKPPGYRLASASSSLKALKQKGKARGAISPVAEEREAAPAQARRTASLSVSPSRQSPKQQLLANEASLETSDKSADISRISASSPDTSAANASAVSPKAATKSKPVKKRKSIIEVVIPYRHDISREGSTYSGETSRKSRKSKAAEAGSTSKILDQMPSSSYPARKISPLKKTASESLTYTRKPAVSSVKASSSLPIAGQEDEVEDDFLLTSSSSPIRGADITDSFSVTRRRHGNNDDTVSSSPVCQAEKRKRERSNSNSHGSSASSHRLLAQSAPASIADDLETLVDTITGLDEAGLRRLLNRLPSSRLELLRGTSEKTLKERASKKPRRA